MPRTLIRHWRHWRIAVFYQQFIRNVYFPKHEVLLNNSHGFVETRMKISSQRQLYLSLFTITVAGRPKSPTRILPSDARFWGEGMIGTREVGAMVVGTGFEPVKA